MLQELNAGKHPQQIDSSPRLISLKSILILPPTFSNPWCLSTQATPFLCTNSHGCMQVLKLFLLFWKEKSLPDMICLYEHTLPAMNIKDKILDECVAVKLAFSHVLGLPGDLWYSSLLTDILYTIPVSSIRAACPTHLIVLDLFCNNISFILTI
jgi:hypothetical protein